METNKKLLVLRTKNEPVAQSGQSTALLKPSISSPEFNYNFQDPDYAENIVNEVLYAGLRR